MAIRIQIVRSAFQASLLLAASLLAAIATTLYLKPVAALTAAQQPQNPTAERAPMRERFDTDDARAASEPDVSSAYEQALRQACALPASEWNWQGLGPATVALSKSICQADAATQTRWRAGLLARMKSDKNSAPQFLSGAIAAHEKGSVWWASAGANGLWRGTPDGWRAASNAATEFVAVSPADPQVIYALRAGNQLDQSTDGGATFIAASAPFPEKNVLNAAPLALHATDAAQVWTGGRALWRSTNGGERWERITDNVQGTASNRVSAIALPWASSSYVLAGTSEGWIQRFNLGAEAAANNLAVLPRRGYVSSLTFDPHDARIAYATFSTFGGAHVWQSADQGLTWQPLDGAGPAALPDVPVNALAVDSQAAGRLFVGTDLGVFVTEDNGQHWSQALPGVWVTALQFTTTGQLYAFVNSENGASLRMSGNRGAQEKAGGGASGGGGGGIFQCVSYYTPHSLVFKVAGETKTVNITAPDNCDWTVTVDPGAASWVSIVGANSGRGSGTITLMAAENLSNLPRLGSVAFAGNTLPLLQEGTFSNCRTSALSPGVPQSGQLLIDDCLTTFGTEFYLADNFTFEGREGELISARLTVAPQNIPVGILLKAPDGTLIFPNNLTAQFFEFPKGGTYTMQVYTALSTALPVNYRVAFQLISPGCDNFTLTALDREIGGAANTGRLSVSTASNCAWQVLSSAPWLTLPTASGRGSQTINFNVTENSDVLPRRATLEIGSQRTEIVQAGRGNDCAIRMLATGNQTLTGTLTVGDCAFLRGSSYPVDMFAFDGKAGQRVTAETIVSNLVAGGYVYRYDSLRLYNARNEIVFPSGTSISQTWQINGQVLPEDGRYYVVVSSNNLPVEYTLKFSLAPAECTYRVAPEKIIANGNAGTARFNLLTDSQCPWQNMHSQVGEVAALQSGLQGVGPSPLAIPLPANNTDSRRSFTSYINGQPYQIMQLGKNATCDAVPITPGVALQGAIAATDCAAQLYPLGGSADRFSFAGTQGQVFTFTPNAVNNYPNSLPSILMPVGYGLLDPDGQLLVAGQTDPTLPPPSIVLPRSGVYQFELAGSPTLQLYAYSLTVNLTTMAADCAAVTSVSDTRFESAGGNGTVNIEAPAGCPWRVELLTNNAPFVFNDATEGTGSGQVSFTFRPNTNLRTGLVVFRVGRQTFTLEQAGPGGTCQARSLPFDQFVSGQILYTDCAVNKPPESVYATRDYGDVYTFQGSVGEQIGLTAPRQYEPESFRLVAPTVKLYDPDGLPLEDALATRNLMGHYFLPKTGLYRVTVTSPYNTQLGVTRDYQLLLERLTAGCIYSLANDLHRFDDNNGSGSYRLTTSGQCQWKPRVNVSWIHLSSPSGNDSIAGSAAGTYTVDANLNTTARIGAIVAGGRVVEIEQAGLGGKCAVLTLTPNVLMNVASTANDCSSRINQWKGNIFRFTTQPNDRFHIQATSSLPNANFNFTLLDETWRTVTGWTSNQYQPWLTLVPGTYYLVVQGGTNQSITHYSINFELLNGTCELAFEPPTQLFAGLGGTGTINVRTRPNCAWTASTGFNWLSLIGGRSGTGNGTVSYQVQPFDLIGGTRTGAIQIGDRTVPVLQSSAGENCEPVTMASGQMLNGLIEAGDCNAWFMPQPEYTRADRYQFTAQPGKQLAIETSRNLFITLFDAQRRVVMQGSSNRLPTMLGTQLRYLVLPDNATYGIEIAATNSAGLPFTYTLKLATPTVTQCAVTLSQLVPAQSQPIAAAGGTGTIQIVAPTGCQWEVVANSQPLAWVSFTTPTRGTGTGTVGYSFAANDTQRYRVFELRTTVSNVTELYLGQLGTGSTCQSRAITLGQVVRGTLAEGDCRTTLRPQPEAYSYGWLNANPPVHQFTFNAMTGDQLSVLPRLNSSGGQGLLSLFDPRGQAIGQTRVIALPYSTTPTPLTRLTLPFSGTYTLEYSDGVGDYEFVLDVTSGGCGFALESENTQMANEGGVGTVDVVTSGDCQWSAYSTEPWITVTSGSGSGNGKVTFTVAPNNVPVTAQTRRGFIRLAGQAISVIQAGYEGSCAPVPIPAGQSLSGQLTRFDCMRLNQNQQLAAPVMDRYSFTARAGQQAQVKVVNNASLGVQILPFSALRLSSVNSQSTFPNPLPVDWFGTASLMIPADGTYIIEIMPANYIDQPIPYTVQLELNEPGCGVLVNETAKQFDNNAAQGSFSVLSPAGCNWQVYAVNDWITVAGARSRTGTDSVSYTLTANTGSNVRLGSIIVGGQIVLIEQAGAGNASGGSGSCVPGMLSAGQTILGNLSAADCRSLVANTAIGSADRFTFTGRAGQRVQIIGRFQDLNMPKLSLFDANQALLAQGADNTNTTPKFARIPQDTPFYSLPQDGTYTVEIATRYNLEQTAKVDYSLSLVIAPTNCSYSVNANPLRFNSAGGVGSLSVVTGTDCTWAATTTDAWVVSANTAMQSGNGATTFTVQPNPSNVSRRSLLLVGGRICVIEQAGAAGSCTPRPVTSGQIFTSRLDEQDCSGMPVRADDRPQTGLSFYAERYSFTAQANDRLFFSVTKQSPGYLQFPLRLIGPNGVEVLASTNNRLPAQGDRFTLPVNGTYEIEISSNEKFDFEATFLLSPSACQIGFNLQNWVFETAGGTGTISMTAAGECVWQAYSNSPWVTFSGSSNRANGAGSAALNFSVAANTTAQARSAIIAVADTLLKVEQAGLGGSCVTRTLTRNQLVSGTWDERDCRAVEGPYNAFVDRYKFNANAGERISLTLQANVVPVIELYDPQERLLLSGNVRRLPSEGGDFVLPASGLYTVLLKSYVTQGVNSYELLVTDQQACTYTITPDPIIVAGTSGTRQIQVIASQPSCTWTARSNTNWLSLSGATAPPSYQIFRGTQTLELVLPTNHGGARTGFLSIADQIVSVRQAPRSLTAVPEPLVCMNAASMQVGPEVTLAPNSMVSAFGKHLATETRIARPFAVELGATRVTVTDQTQLSYDAYLTLVSPTQVNFILPFAVVPGPVTINVTSGDGFVTSCVKTVNRVAPGVFTINANGNGLAAGVFFRTGEGLPSTYEPLVRYDVQKQEFAAMPVQLGNQGETVYLVLYGTGWRGRADLSSVVAQVGNVNLTVSYCDKQNELGLDQINLVLPPALAGRGLVTLELSIDGKPANTVKFAVK